MARAVSNKEGVTRWLNRLAKSVKQFSNIKDYSQSITKCNQCVHGINNIPYVQLHRGIHTICDLLGLDIKIYDKDEDSVTYYFMWDDVMFLQLDNIDKEDV